MKKTFIIVLLLIFTIQTYGNDGTYMSSGGIIYPINESKISLDKEILSFKIKDKTCKIDILFEFNNPEKVSRKILIGFQAPKSMGDISEEVANTCQIKDFKILANNEILPYKLKVSDCENCELKEVNEAKNSELDDGIFVYLFEFTFKPGINYINHSYSFVASTNVMINQYYEYILTTGSKWAGATIKNLTVNVDIGQNQYFYINDIFGTKAKWSIVGTGKVTNKKIYLDEDTCKMIRILSGNLQIVAENYKPYKNIHLGIICETFFLPQKPEQEKIELSEVSEICNLSLENKNYSKETLKILRNTIYAQYGYSFSNINLKNYFLQFEWYIPDPNLKMEQIILSEKEKLFIEKILLLEQQ